MSRGSTSQQPAWLDERLSPTDSLRHTQQAKSFDWDKYSPPPKWIEELADFFKKNGPKGPESDAILLHLIRQSSNKSPTGKNIKKILMIVYAIMTGKVKPSEAGINFKPEDISALSGTIRNIVEGLAACGAGTFERLKVIHDRWESPESLDGFLADYRVEVIDKLARSRFGKDKDNVREGMETHRVNYYLVLANSIGFPVRGAVQDIHYQHETEGIKLITTKAIEAKIKEVYTPLRILQYIEARVQGITELKPGVKYDAPKITEEEIKKNEHEEKLQKHNDSMTDKLTLIFGVLGRPKPEKSNLANYFKSEKVSISTAPQRDFNCYTEIDWQKIRELIFQSLCDQHIIKFNNKDKTPASFLYPNNDAALLPYWFENIATQAATKAIIDKLKNNVNELREFVLTIIRVNPNIEKIKELIGKTDYYEILYTCLIRTSSTPRALNNHNYMLHLLCLDDSAPPNLIKKEVLNSLKSMLETPAENKESQFLALIKALDAIKDKNAKSNIALSIIHADWFNELTKSDIRIFQKILTSVKSEKHQELIEAYYSHPDNLDGLNINCDDSRFYIFSFILGQFETEQDRSIYWSWRFTNTADSQMTDKLVTEFKKEKIPLSPPVASNLSTLFKHMPEKYKFPLLQKLNNENILSSLIYSNKNITTILNSLKPETMQQVLNDKTLSLFWKRACIPIMEVSSFPDLLSYNTIYIQNSPGTKNLLTIKVPGFQDQKIDFPTQSDNRLTDEEIIKLYNHHIQQGVFRHAEQAKKIFAENVDEINIWDALQTPQARYQYLVNINAYYPTILNEIQHYLFADIDRIKKTVVDKMTSENNDEYLYKLIDLLGGIPKVATKLGITNNAHYSALTKLTELMRILPKQADQAIQCYGSMQKLLHNTLLAAQKTPTIISTVIESLPDDATKNKFLSERSPLGLSGLQEVSNFVIGCHGVRLPLNTVLKTLPENLQIELFQILIFCYCTKKTVRGLDWMGNNSIPSFADAERFIETLKEVNENVRSIFFEIKNAEIILRLLPFMTTKELVELLAFIKTEDREKLTIMIDRTPSLGKEFLQQRLMTCADKNDLVALFSLLPKPTLINNAPIIVNLIKKNVITIDEAITALQKNNSTLPRFTFDGLMQCCRTLEDLNFALKIAQQPDDQFQQWLNNESNMHFIRVLFDQSDQTERYKQLADILSASQFIMTINQAEAMQPDLFVAALSALKTTKDREQFLTEKNIGLGAEPGATHFLVDIARRDPAAIASALTLVTAAVAQRFAATLLESPLINSDFRISCQSFATILEYIPIDKRQGLISKAGGIQNIAQKATDSNDLLKLLYALKSGDYDDTINIENAIDQLLQNNKEGFFELFKGTPESNYPLLISNIKYPEKYINTIDDVVKLFKNIHNDKRQIALINSNSLLSNRIKHVLEAHLFISETQDQTFKLLDTNKLLSVLNVFCNQEEKNKTKLVNGFLAFSSIFKDIDDLMSVLQEMPESLYSSWISIYNTVLTQSGGKQRAAADFATHLALSFNTNKEKSSFIQKFKIETIAAMVKSATDLADLLHDFPDDPSPKACVLDNTVQPENASMFDDNTLYLYVEDIEYIGKILYCKVKTTDGEIKKTEILIDEEDIPNPFNNASIANLNIFEILDQTSRRGLTQNAHKMLLIKTLGVDNIVTLIEKDPKALTTIYKYYPPKQREELASKLRASKELDKILFTCPQLAPTICSDAHRQTLIKIMKDSISSIENIMALTHWFPQNKEPTDIILMFETFHAIANKFPNSTHIVVNKIAALYPNLIAPFLLYEALLIPANKALIDALTYIKPSKTTDDHQTIYQFSKVIALLVLDNKRGAHEAFKELTSKSTSMTKELLNLAKDYLNQTSLSPKTQTSNQAQPIQQMRTIIESNSIALQNILKNNLTTTNTKSAGLFSKWTSPVRLMDENEKKLNATTSSTLTR